MWQIQVCFSQEKVFLGASLLVPKSGDCYQIGPRSAPANKHTYLDDKSFDPLTMFSFHSEPLRGNLHIDFHKQCIIMTQISWPSLHPVLYASFPDFWQNPQFSKNVSNVPDTKKVDLESFNLHIIAGYLSFSSDMDSRRK